MLRPVMRLHPATTGILLLVVCFLSACSGDDPSQPNSGPVPSFDSIWPAGVGRYWVYDQVVDEYEGGATVYDRAEDIPDLPSMAQLYADLQTDPSGALLASADTRFGSRMTADLTANPDTTVMACENYVVDPGIYESPPLGLSVGTQWRFSSDRIAVYSSRFLQWVHLDGALTPGHEFSTPLACRRRRPACRPPGAASAVRGWRRARRGSGRWAASAVRPRRSGRPAPGPVRASAARWWPGPSRSAAPTGRAAVRAGHGSFRKPWSGPSAGPPWR